MNQPLAIPAQSGAYIFFVVSRSPFRLKAGSRPEQVYPAGFFGYAGSAHGPGGLLARIGRHFRGGGKHHWHIDWLRDFVTPYACYYAVSTESYECTWSQLLWKSFPKGVVSPGFGSSDCRNGCLSHLYWMGSHLPDLFLASILGDWEQTVKVESTFIKWGDS